MVDGGHPKRTKLGPAIAPEARALRPGTFVGRYALLRRIGIGGMGEVWEAVDPAVTEPVALKLLTFDGGSSAMQRFVRESNVAREIGHPNVVPTIDTGWWDGSPFLVMPLVRGTSLAELAGRMEPARVAELLEGAARGLDAIHAAGVVHRDVKPSNLVATDAGDTVVLDFGLATLADDHLRLTRPGTVSGSPHYMSPEAAFGHVPDARGDVYSLAAVAYRLLAGRPPTVGRDSVSILSAKLSRPPPRLSEVGAPVPRALDTLLRQALSRDPSRRPASAGELIARLREAASDTCGPDVVDSDEERGWLGGDHVAPMAALVLCAVLASAVALFFASS